MVSDCVVGHSGKNTGSRRRHRILPPPRALGLMDSIEFEFQLPPGRAQITPCCADETLLFPTRRNWPWPCVCDHYDQVHAIAKSPLFSQPSNSFIHPPFSFVHYHSPTTAAALSMGTPSLLCQYIHHDERFLEFGVKRWTDVQMDEKDDTIKVQSFCPSDSEPSVFLRHSTRLALSFRSDKLLPAQTGHWPSA